MEIPKQLAGADQFDLAEVKKMVNSKVFGECFREPPIFKWRIMNLMPSPNACESQFFPVNNNQNIGQLSFNYSKDFEWSLTMTLDDLGRKPKEPSHANGCSYFIIMYKFTVEGHARYGPYDEDFCYQAIVFGTGKNKATICWELDFPDVHYILLDLYQVSAADIPNFFLSSSNSNMIVGECNRYSDKLEKPEPQVDLIFGEERSFHFGSAEQLMTVRFLDKPQQFNEDRFGISATLHIVNERTNLVPCVPFVVTFTIFTEDKDKSSDIVNRIVLRREEKEFEHLMFLAFYDELEDLMARFTIK